jgi:hypothetical protein
MFTLTSKEIRESLKQRETGTAVPVQQTRGLSVPTQPPPAELAATPGVEDSAERAAQRANLIALVRKQQEELPVKAADQAFRGAIAGGLSGLGVLLLRSLLSPKRFEAGPEYLESEAEEYQEPEVDFGDE